MWMAIPETQINGKYS